MRKPVAGGARTGDTEVQGGADDEDSETDGVSEGDVAEGGEPWRGVTKPAVGRVVSSRGSPLYVTEPVLAGWAFTFWSCARRRLLEMEGRKSMGSSEELIKQMFEENLGRAANLDVSVADSEVSSLEAVAFITAVGEAYDVALPPEEVAKFTTLRDFINYIDSHRS